MRLPGALVLGAAVNAATIHSRADPRENIGLYAYGAGIGGLPVFYNDGLAFITDLGTANTTSMVPVRFTFSDTTFTAQPNITSNNSSFPGFESAVFGIPPDGASSRQAIFLGNDTSNGETTSGFGFFGQIVFLEGSDASLQTEFYAEPTDTEGIWALTWDDADAEGAVPVTVKDSAPPNLEAK
ncbi:hypothetical protein DL764_004543 [Monosporascus ibericus]|uniref:Uncharacterized protein n=1 Tax=Monosporascus ibericus TaxID=155417 RepID=A0A4Q4TFI6_9PEZI|nr:hypothetical protein DL764_004543 [Monosporascus ibericus]